MSLDTFTVTRPNILNQASTSNTDDLALIIEEFSGLVEGTIARRSALQGWINFRSVKGTSTLMNYAVGETTLSKVVPGVTPDGQEADFSRIGVTIDTLVYARNTVPLLDTFQTQYDARKHIAEEHGKKIAKFSDQALFIQAAKAAAMTTSPYGSAGHTGGTTVTLGAGESLQDPAVINAALANLLSQMEEKDVDPQGDDLMIALPPKVFYALIQSEQVSNGEYITAEGNKIKGMIFNAFGVPVIRSNNIPQSVITGHLLSNARNSNAYDGDFSKLGALVFSPRALLAGETVPLQKDVFYDKISKSWYIDSHTSFGVTPNRPEFAGRIVLP